MNRRHLHLDPFCGAAGDMFLGLLRALGVPAETLASIPSRLGLPGVEVSCAEVLRGGLAASRVRVCVRGAEEAPARPGGDAGPAPNPVAGHPSAHAAELQGTHAAEPQGTHAAEPQGAHAAEPQGTRAAEPQGTHAAEFQAAHAAELQGAHAAEPQGAHAADLQGAHPEHGRFLADVRALIARADLPTRAKEIAEHAFELLFAAEARVHGVPLDRVHLHEAGADDALVDVCGTALGLVTLGIESVTCGTPIPVGSGTIRCAHGVLPVPGPAVAELLAGLPVSAGPSARELVTPTGAALLRAVTGEFRALPTLVLERAGHGAGGWAGDAGVPNVLRGLLGQLDESGPRERSVAVIETALDDALPQDIPVLIERLLAAGARDAHVTPVLMKKGRPGFLLTAVCDPERARDIASTVLRESPTLGVRIRRDERLEWDRDTVLVTTPWGPVRIKRALDGQGRPLRGQPEFEDCRRVADEAGVPVDDVRRRALHALHALEKEE